MDSHEPLSVAQICHRLSLIREGEAHLRAELPPENPHNAVLRLRDVTRYIDCRANEVLLWFPTMTRVSHRLRDRPPPKKAVPLPAARQWDFSRFFWGFDEGRIIKARVGDEWKIISRHSHPLPLGAAARQEAPAKRLDMRIDLTALGPRLKL